MHGPERTYSLRDKSTWPTVAKELGTLGGAFGPAAIGAALSQENPDAVAHALTQAGTYAAPAIVTALGAGGAKLLGNTKAWGGLQDEPALVSC